MARIVGLLFSGAAVRLAGAGAAIWIGSLAAHQLASSLAVVNNALSVLP